MQAIPDNLKPHARIIRILERAKRMNEMSLDQVIKQEAQLDEQYKHQKEQAMKVKSQLAKEIEQIEQMLKYERRR